MALLQKKPHVSTSTVLYHSSLALRTIAIIGLGNPESKYRRTRHNIGFDCIDHFAHSHDFPGWKEKPALRFYEASQQLGSNRILLIKPTSYMNRSGEAAAAVKDYYKLSTQDILAVYDDIDVLFGTLKVKLGGGSAGHNGVKSLIEHLGADFGRLRVGVGPKLPEQIDSADFVLAKFSEEQQTHIPTILKESTALLTEVAFSGGELQPETRSVFA